MKRLHTQVRTHWQQKAEELGFLFHHTDEGLYWDESVYYAFDYDQVETLERATARLYRMCLHAAEYMIRNRLYDKLGIPDKYVPLIEKSWQEDHPVLYGRFDLRYDGVNPPQLLEFNADTPTSLFEASIVQWFWLQDKDARQDQFNSIHEKLIAQFQYLKPYYHTGKMHFACVKDNVEDLINTEYLRDCAMQAGLDTGFVYMEDIGFDELELKFVDQYDQPIKNIFKLYPWEWMIREAYGPELLEEREHVRWTEPPWKMLLSNKALLPVLWKLFKGHKNLLPAFFEEDFPGSGLKDYVKKPKLSREGANVSIYQDGQPLVSREGEYGEEGFIYQQFRALPAFEGRYPVIGSWIIGQEPAGMGIRESSGLITDNFSRFVPHLIVK